MSLTAEEKLNMPLDDIISKERQMTRPQPRRQQIRRKTGEELLDSRRRQSSEQRQKKLNGARQGLAGVAAAVRAEQGALLDNQIERTQNRLHIRRQQHQQHQQHQQKPVQGQQAHLGPKDIKITVQFDRARQQQQQQQSQQAVVARPQRLSIVRPLQRRLQQQQRLQRPQQQLGAPVQGAGALFHPGTRAQAPRRQVQVVRPQAQAQAQQLQAPSAAPKTLDQRFSARRF
eukprot:m51a1_g5748 hypothetical protein (230) ;mRNA; f:1180942-1181857